jgi:hypothetical protein
MHSVFKRIHFMEGDTKMLYQIHINPKSGRPRNKYQEWLVEGPEYKMDGSWPVLDKDLEEYAVQKAGEASVMWGFPIVHAVLWRVFPASVGMGEPFKPVVFAHVTAWDVKALQGSGEFLSERVE